MNKAALWSTIVLIVFGLTGAGMSWIFAMNARIALLEDRLMRAQTDTAKLETDRQLKMLWRYGAWNHHQLDVLRSKAGLEVAESPVFE